MPDGGAGMSCAGIAAAGRPALFWDLDGPLLDVRARYHGVYALIAAELGIPPLGPVEYWSAKRRRSPLEQLFPGIEDEARLRSYYLERWLARIEAPEWLSRDVLVLGALECLDRLAASHRLYLVTLRRDPAALAEQLEQLRLRPYFAGVFSGWAPDEAARLKAGWIDQVASGPASWIIGDTEVDMEAARLSNIGAVGVSFGIREPDDLIRAGAAEIVDDLCRLPSLLTPSSRLEGVWR